MKYTELKPGQYFKFVNETKSEPLIWIVQDSTETWPFNPLKAENPTKIFTCRLAANRSGKRVPNPNEEVAEVDPWLFPNLIPELTRLGLNEIIDHYNSDPCLSAESALSKIISLLESSGQR